MSVATRSHIYLRLPSTRREGAWIHFTAPLLEGWRIWRTMKAWLRPYGFRLTEQSPYTLTVRYQRGKIRSLVAIIVLGCGQPAAWLVDGPYTEQFAAVCKQLEVQP